MTKEGTSDSGTGQSNPRGFDWPAIKRVNALWKANKRNALK